MSHTKEEALRFIESISLDGTPRYVVPQNTDTFGNGKFDSEEDQARVIGSSLFSFQKGVNQEVRDYISDTALLAQLHADKTSNKKLDPRRWYREYTKVVGNLGWTLLKDQSIEKQISGRTAEVHEKILEVIASFALGGAAPAIITSSINALKGMNPESSWFKIFNRDSDIAKISHFQIGLVNSNEDDDIEISSWSYLLEAESSITQVLFFKFKSSDTQLSVNSDTSTLNRTLMTNLSSPVKDKIKAYADSYLSTILDLNI